MITIIDYDGGNINSLSNILKRLNVEYVISDKESDISNSSKIILPGVSNFQYCVSQIKKKNLDKIIKNEVFEKKKPFLGICSGMQVLSKFSEEGNIDGLSFIDANVKKFIPSPKLRVPHVGWNKVYFKENKIFENIENGSRFYFCHSFYMSIKNPKINKSISNYDKDFVAGFNINNLYAVQFHPEKSYENGIKLINNFINLS